MINTAGAARDVEAARSVENGDVFEPAAVSLWITRARWRAVFKDRDTSRTLEDSVKAYAEALAKRKDA